MVVDGSEKWLDLWLIENLLENLGLPLCLFG